MGYKIVVNEYSNLPGLNSTKVLVSEYAAIGTKTTKVIVVEDTNIGSAAYNEAKAAAVTATNAANQATATLANAVVKSNPISDVVQGTAANSLTRKDYVNAEILKTGTGFRVETVVLPASAPSTGYIPLRIGQVNYTNPEIYISTAGGSGNIPMNNCSFTGLVRAAGWDDHTSYVTGYFTAYDMSKRAIHSIHGPSESANGYVFYLDVRAFPVIVKLPVAGRIECPGGDIQFGTSLFKVNGQLSGNIKTVVLANFDKGTGFYNGSSRVYNDTYKPSAADLNVVNKTGDTMTGSLVAAKIKNSVMVNDKGSISLQDSGGSRFHLYSDGNAFKLTHGNDGEIGILSIGSNGTASLTGGLTLSKGGNGITLNPAVGSSSYILGQQGGIDNWYVGKGSANDDSIQLSSYAYGTSISLQSDRVVSNKPLYVGTNRAYDEGFKPTTNDVQAASFRTNFASQLGINRSITGATVPTHAGVWDVNASTWTPVGYGSLYVTTNRVDELTTTGTGSFIHYLFISHNAARVYSATNVNGTWSGWRAVIDDRRIVGTVSQSAEVPTGAIIERGTFANGEYVKYADGTMMQWGRFTISNRAVTSAIGTALFQSATVDAIPFGPSFVGSPSPSAHFLYASGGARPWPILTGFTQSSVSFVLQCGVSVSAMGGEYVWQVMGRWF